MNTQNFADGRLSLGINGLGYSVNNSSRHLAGLHILLRAAHAQLSRPVGGP